MAPLLLLGIFTGAIIAGYAYRGRQKTQEEPTPPLPVPPRQLPSPGQSFATGAAQGFSIPSAPPAGAPPIAPTPAVIPAWSTPSSGAFTPYVFERTRTGFVHDRVNLNHPQIARWQPMIYGAATVWAPRMGVPVDQLARFAIAWLGVESGGNICATGDKLKVIPPGNAPREVGLFQLYNPSDFKKLGIDPLELVAYCVRPAKDVKNPQKLSRQPSEVEKARHIEIGMRFLDLERDYALRYMNASGVTWPADSIDTWKMTKLVHGLPVIVNTGLAQVTRKLGRAPASWSEFRATYETINPRAIYNPKKDHRKQDGYWRALQNAEWVGDRVAPFTNV